MEETGKSQKWHIVETCFIDVLKNRVKKQKNFCSKQGGVNLLFFLCIIFKSEVGIMARKKEVKKEDILNLIKIEYISDSKTSYRKLAEKYNYPFKKISTIGKKEKWGQLRVQFGDKVFKKTMNRISTEKADEYSRVIESANRLIGVIERSLDDPKQFNRYVVTENFAAVEKVFKKADTRALKEMTASLKELAAVVGYANEKKNAVQGNGNEIKVEFTNIEEGFDE